MALGFSSHYRQDNQATFGSLTKGTIGGESESAGTVAHNSFVIGQSFDYLHNSLAYDSCEFSSSVIIDYSQYATIADGSCSETAGSIASIGGCDFSGDSSASFSSGGSVSFSDGGGMSCASFTC